MCAPSLPTPPDPNVVAQAQGTENRASAVANANLNRVDTQTPYGNLTYTTNGTNPDGTPKYNAAVTLSPQEQNLFDINTANQGELAKTAQGMLGQVQGSYSSPIDTSKAPGLASQISSNGPNITSTVQQDGGTTANAIKGAQDAAYRSQTQYLDPQFQQGEDQLRTRLANQGTVQGSQAYNDAVGNFGLQKQHAYQSAQDSAVTAGNQEQNVLHSQGLAEAGLQNSANQQAFGQGATNANLQNSSNQQFLSDLFSLRNQPLNEFNALTTGAQVQNPTFQNVPQTNQATTNVAGIYQDNFNNQSANAQAQQAYLNSLFQLGGDLGAAAIKSDRRLKRNIRLVGMSAGGFKLYSFEYKSANDGLGTFIGVMADEVRQILPEAVTRGDDGFDRVYYGMLS